MKNFSSAGVPNGVFFWTEINNTTASSVVNMDFRTMLHPRGLPVNENMHSSNTTGLQTDTIGEEYLLDDLAEFSSVDIAGSIECPPAQFSTQSNSLAVTNLRETVRVTPPLEESLNAGTGKDSIRPLCNDIGELDWFSTLDDEPALILGQSNFCGPSFLINYDHKSIYDLGMYQNTYDDQNEKALSSDKPASECVSLSCSSNKNDQEFTLETPVPGRARSKRSRVGGRVWSSGLFSISKSVREGIDLSTENPSIIALRHFSHSQTGSRLHDDGLQDLSGVEGSPLSYPICNGLSSKQAWKASRWKKVMDNSQIRRCVHCLTQKTPQWRIGPTGPKTLCNACGVRFKSGRLFPEYRPAKSPTFVSQQHSNSHKKVMEMRRMKEMGILEKQGKEPNVTVRLNSGRDEHNLADIMTRRRVEGQMCL